MKSFARRIGHYARDADKTDQPGQPTHGQPRAAQRLIETVMPRRPNHKSRYDDSGRYAADMPRARQRIALMNVSADGVALIEEDNAQGLFDLTKVLLRIDPHERSGRAILFA